MNAKRIQELLVALSAHVECPVLACEAHALLSELCGPAGAVGIADEAAFELLGSECLTETLDGVIWYHIERPSILTHLDTDRDDEIELMARTVRYLARRELLQAHPTNRALVTRREA